jgi:hypothetical protein
MYRERNLTAINHDTSAKDKPMSIVKWLAIVNQSYATKVSIRTLDFMTDFQEYGIIRLIF